MTGVESQEQREPESSRPEESRIDALRRQAANEPGRLAITEEHVISLLASAGQGGSY